MAVIINKCYLLFILYRYMKCFLLINNILWILNTYFFNVEAIKSIFDRLV